MATSDERMGEVLASLRDNIRALVEAERERREELEARQGEAEERAREHEQRLATIEERLTQLRGVLETLHGPHGQNGLVGDVRDLKRTAAELREHRAEFRSGLLWPIAAAVISSILAALFIQRWVP